MWDATFGLPVPPVNAVAPTTVANNATMIFSTLAILAFVYGLKHWRDTGRPILLLILLGGGLTSVAETFVNLVGSCWHPTIGQTILFQFMGRPIPVWIVAVYFAFFGTQGSLFYILFKRGVSMNVMRWLFVIPMLIDVVIETTSLPTGLYLYDGPQPLVFLGMLPLWWAACNSIGMFVGIALVTVCAPHLKGYKALLIPILLPMGDMIGYSAIGLPSFIAINTAGLPNLVVQALGIFTMLLAFLVVHAISLILATDSPLRSKQMAAANPVDAVIANLVRAN